jgi:hypothetical protein
MIEIRVATRAESAVRYAGYQITAPGFDEAAFSAAVQRALADGLTVSPGRAPRTWQVFNSTNLSEYIVSPFGCSCRAGELNRSCKHRALVQLIEAIIGGADRPGGVAP